MDDFTFSNGVHIPKGTLIHGPAATIEADPVIYSEPEVFKPFRFVPDASKPEQPHKEMGQTSCHSGMAVTRGTH